ncbi:hypothetical protein SAMN05660209_00696 [Geodermatophilus africanus]|uniref:Uncharacterized protein n=1 Tax=Geodermatophilus africanus TaxID=1137993 RepID=A0A1H3CPD6_9ACTN|nr:hypothetical protein [Geodermatophilus africanus]SDX55900.1 hypothetical protein SAMN05660209_00696 [Geodermatophilus africanus]
MGVPSGSGARAAGPGGTSAHRRTLRWAAAAALVVAAVVTATTAALAGADGRAVVVRTPDGEVLASVPLTGDRFAVGYRNSVYTTLAEERYRVLPDGRFELVELAADQVAVLEEYYAVPGAPRPAPSGDRRAHVAEPDPARRGVFDVLNIAATELGERTLYVPGAAPVPIWRLVTGQDPTVLLEIER